MNAFYEHAFQRVLYPAYETGLRGRRTLEHLEAYRHDQWLSADELAGLQLDRLRRLLEHCERDVPYYREQWRKLGFSPRGMRNLDDFAQLPVLRKDDIRGNFTGLQAESMRDELLFKVTGGSTGDPLRFGYTRESNDRRAAVMWRGYGWAGARMGRRTLYLWGGAVGDPTRSKQWKDRLYNAAFARKILDSFHMTEANLHEYAEAIDRYRPQVIVGYVGPLVRLARWIVENKRTVWRPSAVIGGAEALHGFQREVIEEAFGCPAYNTYGCREFMLMASECEERQGLHVNADHLVLELRSGGRSTRLGCSGEVVITDLFNYGFPFIRYANGDMATMSTRVCSCGRCLPMLETVDGRVLDAIITANGHRLPGEFFPHMLKDIPGLLRFQLVQRELERLDLSIVRGEGFDDASVAYIRREVAKVLGDSVTVQCHFVADIPLTASGKHRVTICELDSLP
jgi:phenylacetate-coenzyme A ligase PaaK-like adenylate-forming protein